MSTSNITPTYYESAIKNIGSSMAKPTSTTTSSTLSNWINPNFTLGGKTPTLGT